MNRQSITLLDIASRDVTCLAADSSLGEAAHIMAQHRYSSVVVTDAARHPLGIVTERNILHAMRSGASPEILLQTVMSSPVVTLPGAASSLEAYQNCIREGIRHMVLVDDDGVVCGVVSETDFRQHLSLTALAGRRQVIAVARRSVPSLPPHSSLMQALNLMQAQRETCVIVVEDDMPVGIVTERDVVRFYAQQPQETEIPLAQVMNVPVMTIAGEATVNEAAERMLANKVRHLVVVEADGRVGGIVSEHDLTQSMALGLLDEKIEVDEIFLRTFINTIPDLVWLKDASGVYLACNRCFEQLFGAREKDIVGKTDYDFVGKELADFFRDHDRRAMAADKPTVNEEWVTFAADGHRKLLETIKTPMRDSQGKLVGVLGVGRDITERKRIERALQESESEFRTLAENLPDNIIRYDRECRVHYMNPAMKGSIAANLLPVIGKIPVESTPDSSEVRELQRVVERVMDSGERAEVETEMPHPDGELHAHHVIFVAERDKNGVVIGALGIGRDITERKKREWQLNQLNFVMDRVREQIFVLDEEARFLYVNEEVCRSLGYTREELYGGMQLKDIGPGWTPKRWSERWALIRKNVTATFEVTHRRKDGSTFPVEINANYFEYEGRGYNMSLGRDISERKETERQLDEYHQILEGRVVEESTKFRALVEQSLFGIYIIQDGYFRYVNPGMVRMVGYDRAEEIIDTIPAEEFVAEQDRDKVNENIRRRLEGETDVLRYSFTARKRDGSHFVVDVHGRTIEYQGRPAVIGSLVDITEMKRSKEELERLVEEKSARLRQSEELLRTLIEAIPDSIQFKDGDGRWLESNSAARRIFGLDEATSRGRSDVELSGIADPQFKEALLQCAATDRQAWQAGVASRVMEVMQAKNGEQMTFDVIKVPLFHDDGSRKGLVIIGRDITELKRAEASLRIIASVFDNSQEAIVITDAGNSIVDVNPAFTSITGYQRAEVLGKNPRFLSSGHHDRAFYKQMWESLRRDRAWRGEIWNRRKNGEVYAELLSISVICDEAGKPQRHVAVFSDITYFKEHEAELKHVANYDALTGVPNRRLLADRMGQAIAHAQRNGKILAVCYIDLDGFKAINDQFGHDTGDLLLVGVTRRLQEVLRAGDTLARLGGDEFVILFNDLAQENECLQVLERVVHTIATPIPIEGRMLAVSASIGVTFFPADEEDGDTLLRHADQAMYIAKQSGKNRYHMYDQVHDLRVRSMHESRRRILQGLEMGEFELYYQPILELSGNRIAGVEALLRWNHPTRGLLLPAEFLPDIENSELDIRLGNWVLDVALRQQLAWQKAGIVLEVSINISAQYLQTPGFVEVLKMKLSNYSAFTPGKLCIEVLETAALEDMGQSAEVIDMCRKLGVNFALDDFGTGYSSLGYLRMLSADFLKIDQSFIKGMTTSQGDLAIVQGVIALAKAFGRKTIAEGVEQAETLTLLAEMGCDYGQGFCIARPMKAVEFIDWYKNDKRSNPNG